jgi:hypothetical protein
VTTNAVGRIDDRHQARHDAAMLDIITVLQADILVLGMALGGLVGAWLDRR